MKWISNNISHMKAILFSKLFIGIIIVSFVSCQDVLDIDPTDSYAETAIFNDPDLASAHVNYAYRMIPWGFRRPLQYARMSDEISGRGGEGSYWRILQGHATPTFNILLNSWSHTNYTKWPSIKQANEFLAGTEVSDIEPDVLNRLRAEAKTIRAYCYFRLNDMYGGVPLITKPFRLDDDWRISRNTFDEVMNFVLTELDDAIPHLPLTYNAANRGRITKGAAMAIKARALLHYASPLNNPTNNMARWQAAADASKAIIDLDIYSLFPDYKLLFQEAGAWNSEVIWARPTNAAIDQEARIEQLFYPNGERGFGQLHPIQNLVDDFEMIDGLLPKDSPLYDPQNPYVNRDPRFYYTILYNGAPFRGRVIETFYPGGEDSREGTISNWNATDTGYYPNKFITESYSGVGWETSNPPWIWYRYGEVLLNYAEAMYNLGHEDVSREYINKIRSRPGVEMPPVTESGSALWWRLVNERRIELVFEEHRFWDVRRWKIAEDILSRNRNIMYIWKDPGTGQLSYDIRLLHTAYFPPHMYRAPIPQEEIDKNALIEQNPGYTN
jgi:starch-binding outer membrane protein, SusD/RagB family